MEVSGCDTSARDAVPGHSCLWANPRTRRDNAFPFEDYIAELTHKPVAKWNEDQWHVVRNFYLNNVDDSARTIRTQISRLESKLNMLSKGGALPSLSRGRSLRLRMRMY